jgi:1-acyl-sn-glycerol-3-phosphate acyltransferase
MEDAVVQDERRGAWWNVGRAIWYPVKWVSGPHLFLGLERIPAQGPALVVANHISYLDPIYTGTFFDKTPRLPRFLAKDSLFRMPLVGRMATGLGQIPVRRGSADAMDSLREADRSLDAGNIVAIYPEGTITRDPGFWPMRGRTGAARLALDHDVPVIPLVHWNTHLIYDHYNGRKFRPLPRKRVVVRAGEPVDLSAFRGCARTGELLRQVTDHIMGALRDLLAEVRGEAPPAELFQPQPPGRPEPGSQAKDAR